jgi:hypothetical protein
MGLSAPDGNVWRIVEKAGPSNGTGRSPFHDHSLGSELHSYFSTMLPLSPPAFVKALKSEHFHCNGFGEHIDGGTDRHVPDSTPTTCWYFARGSYVENACSAGAVVMIEVRFQGPDAITSFDLTQMSFADPSAHASGLCAPL